MYRTETLSNRRLRGAVGRRQTTRQPASEAAATRSFREPQRKQQRTARMHEQPDNVIGQGVIAPGCPTQLIDDQEAKWAQETDCWIEQKCLEVYT